MRVSDFIRMYRKDRGKHSLQKADSHTYTTLVLVKYRVFQNYWNDNNTFHEEYIIEDRILREIYSSTFSSLRRACQ